MRFGKTGKFDKAFEFAALRPGWRDLRFEHICGSDKLKFSFDYSGIKPIILARELMGWIGIYSKSMLSITEYGIWPSSEDLCLFDNFRAGLGLRSTIGETQDHLFSHNESEILCTFLSLMLEFGWGGYLISSFENNLHKAIFISHDSWGVLIGVQEGEEICTALNMLDVTAG